MTLCLAHTFRDRAAWRTFLHHPWRLVCTLLTALETPSSLAPLTLLYQFCDLIPASSLFHLELAGQKKVRMPQSVVAFHSHVLLGVWTRAQCSGLFGRVALCCFCRKRKMEVPESKWVGRGGKALQAGVVRRRPYAEAGLVPLPVLVPLVMHCETQY